MGQWRKEDIWQIWVNATIRKRYHKVEITAVDNEIEDAVENHFRPRSSWRVTAKRETGKVGNEERERGRVGSNWYYREKAISKRIVNLLLFLLFSFVLLSQ